jgi:hypothetical protein
LTEPSRAVAVGPAIRAVPASACADRDRVLRDEPADDDPRPPREQQLAPTVVAADDDPGAADAAPGGDRPAAAPHEQSPRAILLQR